MFLCSRHPACNRSNIPEKNFNIRDFPEFPETDHSPAGGCLRRDSTGSSQSEIPSLISFSQGLDKSQSLQQRLRPPSLQGPIALADVRPGHPEVPP